MSSVEVEPGAASESVLVTTDSCENIEQMSSSLEEIKSINNSEINNDDSQIENCNNDNYENIVNKSESISNEDDDFVVGKEWISKKKHIFVLSMAGKPIYSR